MVMKRLLLTLAMMLPMMGVVAQDDVAFTNYWQFQSFYNPAAAGRSSMLDINGAYRMEMLGFEDAGQTMLIQGDLPMFFVPKAERHGMGAGFMNDKIGFFSTKRMWVQYAYHHPFGKKNILSIGVKLALLANSFNGTDVELGEGSSDELVPTSDVNGTAFDMDLGLRYERKNVWYAGVSVMHLMSPTVSLGEEKEFQVKSAPTIYVSGGHRLKFRQPEFSLRTAAMFRTDMQTWRADVSGRLCYDGEKGKMYAGLNYSPMVSVALLLGFTFHDVNIGYSYEMYTGGIAVQNGTHEIHIGYQMELNLTKKGKNKHQSVRWL
jgi:type IX secretion system PorP/SprF family membrane protein